MPNQPYIILSGYERVKNKKNKKLSPVYAHQLSYTDWKKLLRKDVFVTSKFWSLVFSVNGGTGRETEHVIRKLFTKFARKKIPV